MLELENQKHLEAIRKFSQSMIGRTVEDKGMLGSCLDCK
jgi:hypothetical protein